MIKQDYDKWTEFRQSNSSNISPNEQNLIAKLHSVYFKHSYFMPTCKCKATYDTFQKWINELNELYEKN